MFKVISGGLKKRGGKSQARPAALPLAKTDPTMPVMEFFGVQALPGCSHRAGTVAMVFRRNGQQAGHVMSIAETEGVIKGLTAALAKAKTTIPDGADGCH